MLNLVVIGLGNPLMKDEGIGVHLVKLLRNRFERRKVPAVQFLDLGTSGFNVLHAIAHKRKVVFVDCAFMGKVPGTLRRFTPDDICSKKDLKLLSLHEGDLLRVLALSRKLGEYPAEVIIFGIEPKEVLPGNELTDVLSSKLDEYLNSIEQEILYK